MPSRLCAWAIERAPRAIANLPSFNGLQIFVLWSSTTSAVPCVTQNGFVHLAQSQAALLLLQKLGATRKQVKCLLLSVMNLHELEETWFCRAQPDCGPCTLMWQRQSDWEYVHTGHVVAAALQVTLTVPINVSFAFLHQVSSNCSQASNNT